MAGNFIGMVFGVLKERGIDTSDMSVEEAIEKYNELGSEIKESGGKKEEKYIEYTGNIEMEKHQPSIDYDKKVNTYQKSRAIDIYTAVEKDELLNYDNINSYLNNSKKFTSEEENKLNALISDLDSCLGETDENMICYRGIAVKKENLSVGDEIRNKGFTSTSYDKSVANDFAEYYNGTTIELKVKRGSRALFIGYHAKEFDEAEILFARNSKIVITEISDDGVKGELIYE